MKMSTNPLGVALLAFAASLSATAQTIICEKQGRSEAPDLGDNMACVAFHSTLGDWVIQPIKADRALPRRRSDDGRGYVYEFLADVSVDKERTYILSRRGSAITDQCVAKGLRKGYRVVYSLTEQADTLQRIEARQGGGAGLYSEADKACVEITTTMDNLSLKSGWPVKESRAANGARQLEVVVNLKTLKTVKAELDSLNRLLAVKDKETDYLNEAALTELGRLESEVETCDSIYTSLATLTIGGAGIKPLPVSLTDLGNKERRRYAVVALTESFDALLAHARSMRDGRGSHIDYGYYDAACIAYDKAIGHKDAPQSELETLRNERNDMAAVRKLVWLMGRAQELADKAEREHGFNSDAVYKNLLARCNVAKKLMADYPDLQGVQEVHDTTYSRLLSHPSSQNHTSETVTVQRQVISGKVVKGTSFLLNVSGLRVYAVSVPGRIKAKNYKKEIGKIGQDGSFRIVLPEPTSYIYIEGEKESRPISPTTADMGTLVLEG